jgi:pimeloyl-ACP methyl ester carboxylesterase
VTRPRILLIPEFTELEWAIKPRLEEWAEVASYDPPGVGGEPPADQLDREAIVARGLQELDRRGWDRCFVASDGWGIATAGLMSLARPDAVAGLALGHTKLSYRREGERAPVNAAVWAAMRELIGKYHEAFVRYGAAQVTGGVDRRGACGANDRTLSRPNCSRSAHGTRSPETTWTSESYWATSHARCCSPSTRGA